MVAQCDHFTYDANVIEFMVISCGSFFFIWDGGLISLISQKEACYARCNCWTDLPSQGGEIYKEVCLLLLLLHEQEVSKKGHGMTITGGRSVYT